MQVAANKNINRQAENTSLQNPYEAAVSNSSEYGKEYQEVKEARKKIGDLVSNAEWRQFVSKETLERYEKYLEKQKGMAPANSNSEVDSLENLLGLYEFMSSEWQAAKERLSNLNNLLSALPKHYQNALVKKLILSGKYDLSEANARKFEDVIRGKIKRFEENNKEFDVLAKNPLAKKQEVLKIQQKGSIKLNNKKSFMEATTTERREFLEKIEEAILNEEIREAFEEKNLDKVRTSYLKKLSRYYSTKPGKGCLGFHTWKKFETAVYITDLEELKIWDAHIEREMADRVMFWKTVRSALKGPALAEMEKNMHIMGHTDWEKAFERMKETESKRLLASYNKALEEYEGNIIGAHSKKEFSVWFEELPLKAQYDAESKLGNWEAMGKYKELWDQIKKLDKEDREFMESQIDVWGFTELAAKLKELKNKRPEAQLSESEQKLARVQNITKQNGIKDIAENLEDRSENQVNNVIRLLEYKGRQKEEGYQEDFEQERGQASENVRDKSIASDVDENQKNEAEVIELDEYRNIKTAKGEKKEVMADEERGMNNLLADYNGTEREAKLVKVSIYDESRTNKLELNKRDAANAALYIKAIRKERQETQEN